MINKNYKLQNYKLHLRIQYLNYIFFIRLCRYAFEFTWIILILQEV